MKKRNKYRTQKELTSQLDIVINNPLFLRSIFSSYNVAGQAWVIIWTSHENSNSDCNHSLVPPVEPRILIVPRSPIDCLPLHVASGLCYIRVWLFVECLTWTLGILPVPEVSSALRTLDSTFQFWSTYVSLICVYHFLKAHCFFKKNKKGKILGWDAEVRALISHRMGWNIWLFIHQLINQSRAKMSNTRVLFLKHYVTGQGEYCT